MTIGDARIMKDAMEKRMLAEIQQFEEKTGAAVSCIHLSSSEAQDAYGRPDHRHTWAVNAEVKL